MRSPLMSLFPAASWRWFRALQTSPNSSPYLNDLPLFECTTAVDWGSCLAMASKMGNLGRVEDNLGRDPIFDSLTRGLHKREVLNGDAIGLPRMQRNAGVKDMRQATIGKGKRGGL